MWPEFSVQIVYRVLGHMPLNIYIGQTNGRKCVISKKIFSEYDLVLVYDYIYRVFIVWNTDLHRCLHAGKKVTLSIKGTWQLKEICEIQDITTIPHKLNATNGAESFMEQVIVCSQERLYWLCSHIDYYLQELSGKQKINESVQRKIDLVCRKRRDTRFRDRVLERFHSTCVVCGENEERILEAAHIIGVGNGGSDNISNGICLCANHHIMYDCGLIDIDLRSQTFSCKSEKSYKSDWYLQAKERGFKLFIE